MLKTLSPLFGTWKGTSSLWLAPDEPVRESESTLSAAPVIKGKFIEVKYTWADEGRPQEGCLLIGYESKRQLATAVWVDSWHMGEKSMFCQGVLGENSTIDVRGQYQAPTGPDWGWRIVLRPDDNALEMLMYNILPDGREMLAVKGSYRKSNL